MTEQEPNPTWALLSKIVSSVQYRPGWRIGLTDVQRGEERGLRLDIYSVGYDTYHPDRGQTYRVRHSFIVPAASYNERSWKRWIFDRFVDIETHEAAEFFKLEHDVKDSAEYEPWTERPFAPNHGPGFDPYMVRELNRVEDAETTFTGIRREGSQG